jgi:hypothetical protein
MKRSGFERMAPSADRLSVPVPRKPVTRKCKVCRTSFVVRDMMRDKWCSDDCGAALGMKLLAEKKAKEERAERKRLAEQKAACMPLKKRRKLAQDAANRYVRARDHFLGCCSCEKGQYWDGQWHASHFKSVGSNSRLRFNLWNIHKGCSQCNHFQGGNIAGYEPRLIKKIGAERVEWLKCQNGVTEYTAEYLIRYARVINKKAARQEKRNKEQQ